jgi:cell division protein FtsA
MSSSEFVVGLDIGTTKIFTVVAKPAVGGELKVLGAGSSPARGLKRGVVTSIREASEAIGHSVAEAELSAGVTIRDVYAGISGEHIRSHNLRGSTVISRSGEEVGARDVRKAILEAQSKLDSLERKILHVSPQQFILDGQNGILDPVGMHGVHLEADVHVVTGGIQTSTNLISSIEAAGLRPRELILEPLAARYSLFSEEEHGTGVILVDIGGSLTNVAIFRSGTIRHSFTIPVGAAHVAQDISIGMRTSMDVAEMAKARYGSCLTESVDAEEKVVLPNGGGVRKEVERSRLCAIIRARMEETLELLYQHLEREGLFSNLPAGIVLTGGGSLLDGIESLTEQVFELPARVGTPGGVIGLSHGFSDCRFATGIGLAVYANRHPGHDYTPGSNGKSLLGELGGKVKSFFSDFI